MTPNDDFLPWACCLIIIMAGTLALLIISLRVLDHVR